MGKDPLSTGVLGFSSLRDTGGKFLNLGLREVTSVGSSDSLAVAKAQGGFWVWGKLDSAVNSQTPKKLNFTPNEWVDGDGGISLHVSGRLILAVSSREVRRAVVDKGEWVWKSLGLERAENVKTFSEGIVMLCKKDTLTLIHKNGEVIELFAPRVKSPIRAYGNWVFCDTDVESLTLEFQIRPEFGTSFDEKHMSASVVISDCTLRASDAGKAARYLEICGEIQNRVQFQDVFPCSTGFRGTPKNAKPVEEWLRRTFGQSEFRPLVTRSTCIPLRDFRKFSRGELLPPARSASPQSFNTENIIAQCDLLQSKLSGIRPKSSLKASSTFLNPRERMSLIDSQDFFSLGQNPHDKNRNNFDMQISQSLSQSHKSSFYHLSPKVIDEIVHSPVKPPGSPLFKLDRRALERIERIEAQAAEEVACSTKKLQIIQSIEVMNEENKLFKIKLQREKTKYICAMLKNSSEKTLQQSMWRLASHCCTVAKLQPKFLFLHHMLDLLAKRETFRTLESFGKVTHFTKLVRSFSFAKRRDLVKSAFFSLKLAARKKALATGTSSGSKILQRFFTRKLQLKLLPAFLAMSMLPPRRKAKKSIHVTPIISALDRLFFMRKQKEVIQSFFELKKYSENFQSRLVLTRFSSPSKHAELKEWDYSPKIASRRYQTSRDKVKLLKSSQKNPFKLITNSEKHQKEQIKIMPMPSKQPARNEIASNDSLLCAEELRGTDETEIEMSDDDYSQDEWIGLTDIYF